METQLLYENRFNYWENLREERDKVEIITSSIFSNDVDRHPLQVKKKVTESSPKSQKNTTNVICFAGTGHHNPAKNDDIDID